MTVSLKYFLYQMVSHLYLQPKGCIIACAVEKIHFELHDRYIINIGTSLHLQLLPVNRKLKTSIKKPLCENTCTQECRFCRHLLFCNPAIAREQELHMHRPLPLNFLCSRYLTGLLQLSVNIPP